MTVLFDARDFEIGVSNAREGNWPISIHSEQKDSSVLDSSQKPNVVTHSKKGPRRPSKAQV